MFEVRNRKNQKFNVDVIVDDGDKKTRELKSKEKILTEQKTKMLENLEERGLVRIKEVEEDDDR